MNSLEKNIISTVVYYDILDYPLTSFEIWKYLIENNKAAEDRNEKYDLEDVIEELEKSQKLKFHLDEYRGFYFSKGRKELVEQRTERNKISERKFKIVENATRLLRFVPFVRMVAVTGRMAMKNANKNSDLDFLIVLKQGKIFTGRILVTLLIHLLGIRRYGSKIKDRICLNYFIADEFLDISFKDLFASSEYSFIIPVFGWETFRKFQKKNLWIKDYRKNFQPDKMKNWKLLEDSKFSKNIRKTGEYLFRFGFIEEVLKKFQMNRIMNDPRTHKAGSYVTANDKELIFLPDPQGPEVFFKFEEKIKKVV
jgi:hypothetical protein